MGKASRWLKGLLGSKKEKEQAESTPVTASDDRKEKKRRSFTKPGRDSGGQNELSLRRSYIAESEDEQSKHAIAVAAATAAAADAAVAAAHAAVAVVRFTSKNRATPITGAVKSSAALRIQCVFRGYLARKALRALRALVKLQALVRGFLVRKRTSAALSSMEALLRAQMIVQLQRSRRSFDKENRFQPRRSYEKRSDDWRTEFLSKRHSTSYETAYNLSLENPKNTEVDTYKPRLRSRRINNADNQPVTSPLSYHIPAGIAVADKGFKGFEWNFGDEIKFSTAHNTPRLQKLVGGNSPATPARSVSGEGYLRDYSNCPNYMSSTQSFMAKLRSNSAPKQRPEPGPKRVSLYEVMAARKSLSGVGMQRPATENQVDRFRRFSGET